MTEVIGIEIVDYTKGTGADKFFGTVMEVIDPRGKTDAEVGVLIEEAKRFHGDHCATRMVELVPGTNC